MSDPIALVAALQDQNVYAFLHMIRLGEGTRDEGGYARLFGGGTFADFSRHPGVKVTRGRLTSTAAGAYQFLESTWAGLVRQYGFADFSPKNQDLGCVALIKGRRALDDVIDGRFEQAVMKCNKEWASLPGSPYGQPVVTMAQAKAEYEKHGGLYAPQPVNGSPVKSAPPPPNPYTSEQEQPMPPFIAAALPAVVSAVPELAKIFSGDAPKGEKAERAALAVMGIAKEALGANNEQEVVDAITSDPQAAATLRQAVQDNWFQIAEIGGGVAAAREANQKMQGDRPVWHNPALWISALLLAMPFMLLVDVFYVHPSAYSDNLRTQIVTGVLMVISGVMGYWLGSSMGSAKKDERR